ncbi:GTPase-activator protein for Ras-like GTPase [Colletotrichum sp. SAR11_240]|nr:GTPase-activator protein for Ras-like GTPase [Colletotrichum sp. SAR11_240]
MGIPAAFRWLSNKYPKIISPVIEEQPVKMDDGSEIPVDTTGPNPNGEELDNLYLDMNGIVHPCSHPEDRPAPKDEEEMMLEVFRYTDRVVNMVRPRKLLMIAVDAQQKEEDKEELMKLLKQQNGGVIPEETLESMTKKAFDSNSITPGTPFMDILAASLRYWCAYKLNTDPAWARLKIIISDATVPGEGEHKIMSFVRSQRISPDYDPNTRHVIYGLDADLIMLGLATHEPHFRVLREDVFFQDSKPRVCRICGQKGHEARNCRGEAKEKVGEFDEQEKAPALKPFIWLHVSILREYLAVELNVPGLPFRFDLERALDDWVFMCCFVGNDFLPHLPALEIRENGIDTLTAIWKDNLPHMGGYVTKDGHVDLARAQLILNGLAKQEDGIFKRRKEQEDRREANAKRRKLQEERNQPRNARPKQVDNAAAGLPLFPAAGGPNGITHDMVVGRSSNMNANSANKSAATAIRDQIKGIMSKAEPIPEGDAIQAAKVDAPSASTDAKSILGKRKADGEPDQLSTPTPAEGTSTPSAAEEAAMDHVRMWEEGYADRYYEQKFHVDRKDIEFRHQVARAYVEGLSWVLLYYFQGCPSWEWYYPYHYAPFAADFVELDKMEIAFEKGRISRPFEQLMSVLPAASRHALPEVFHDLMLNEDSEVIDFYPTDFEIDLNGKKMAWQGVALLPFIEMPRLLAAVEKKYPLLSAADRARNGVGRDVLLLSDAHHDLYDEITTNFYSKKQGEPTLKLNPRTSDGLSGKIEKIPDYLPHGELVYPLERGGMPNLDYDRSLSVWYSFPASSHPHKSMLLRGVKLPTAALDRNDIETLKSKSSRSGRSYGGAPLGHNGHNRGGRRDQFSYAPSGGNGRHSGNGNYMQHGTGTHGQELQQDDIVIITRSTLVKISTTAAASVLDSLVALLEDIIRNYKGLPPPTHPPHVLLSEIYILALAADCCTAHWDHVKSQQRQPAVDSGTRRNSPTQAPESLDEALVARIFELLKWLVEPISEGFALPSSTILDDETRQTANPVFSPPSGIASPLLVGTYSSEDETLSTSHLVIMEPCIRVIVEYVTASTWSSSFDYFRNVVYTVRTAAVVQAAPGQSATAPDDDKAALSVLKILSFFWVDAQKLGLIIQEICSSFLHFRKTFQNTVAVVAPLLITRWLERYPHEFVQQHTLHKRLDGGADTLFDMTQTVAAYSLVSLLRAARHFVAEDDAALVSYAMDVQDEAVADLPTETTATVLAMPRRDSNLHSSTNMACDVLKFLDASPHSLFNADGSGEPGAGAAEEDAFLSFLSSLVLLTMCNQVTSDGDGPEVKAIHEFLEARKFLLGSLGELAELPDDVPEVEAASSRLETTLLVSLCSADVDTCQTVTSCIGIFYEENNLAGVSSDAAKTFATLLRNGEVYGEIASRAFRFTGLVAFQKRVRGLLRRLQYPTSGILSAWEYGFERWLLLSREVSMAALDAVDERTLTEWRNYSGFLASLGGICTANQAIIMEEPAISGLRWIDRLPSENHEEPLLGRYLKLSIQLLGCASVRIREATREVLSSEVSSTLYQSLFRALESELEVLFTGALAPSDKAQDVEIIFAEQAISLLKALVERLESPSDLGAASSIHLGALALNFAKFLDGVNDSTNTLRVKIKVCQLCEAVTKRKEHLNLRDDVRIRNQLLEYIFGWIARPRSPRLDSTASTGGRLDEMVRVQKDLDRASLRSLAELTFRLPLQPGEGQTDAGMSELKSQMFHTYFNRFLSLLNHESPESGRSDHPAGIASRDEGTPTSELAITILSNLLSANIDVGLKHSLNIGYHDNVEIRTAFVKVLYNILIQGTEFSNLTDAAVSEKYDELLELLTKDMTLVAAMSAVCPSSEVDELTISLLTIFEHRGLSFELLEVLIKQEIEETDNESEILRRTCVATKMLSVYAKWMGQTYLKATLQKVVERLMLTSKDLDLELDPARVSSTDELQKNALQLRIVAKVFIDDICASSTSMPASFRKICNIISTAVLPRFQEAKYTAVGAFVFLRFFCPAIVAPEVEGLVTTTPSKEMRRGLLLIAKVIQNLANNVLFGAKEPYMFPLNDFLTQNIYRVTTFLREISVAPETIDSPPSIESFDFGSCVALHRFLYDHWDHMRQRLVTQERKDYVRSPAEVSRGRSPVLEPLRHLITNLGPPPLAVTWNRPQISTNTPPSYSRFQNFMLRNAFRSTESFVTARAVYDGGESKDSLSIICIILRHIDAESIDYDTLLYCYLKIASRLWHKPFGLLIDATCYNGQNEPQDELFKKLELLTPVELSRNLVRIYVYNMNSAFRKCFRRLLRVSAKSDTSVFNPKNVDYHLIGSLQDLQAHFHLSQLHLPKETISVVTDTRYVFQPITRLSKTKGKIEVVIKVGSQFVQVTTTKKQEVFPGYRLSTTVNDIFRLGEVEEAPTSIQTEDDSAFGLRADNGKIVMYFTSPKKADVLQTIRGAKAKYGKDTRAHKAYERLIRPQDVPGTLLNLALTNLSSSDHVLRLSSYNLLGALCKAFKFSAASNLMCTKDVSVPMDPSHFIIKISRQLAMSEPQLTFDFLTEFFVGWETFAEEQKPLSLAYMSPWLPGLRTAVLANEADAEKGKEKVAVLFRKLIDVAMTDHSLTYTLEQVVWPAIYQDETVLDIFLEELMRSALSFSYSEEPMEALSSIVSGMGSITLRSPEVRLLVHRLLVNTVHAACTSFNLDDTRFNKLRGSLDFLSEPRSEIFAAPPPFLRDGASMSTTQDSGPSLAATENLAALLFEVCSVAAPSVDISNAWRSRWMSLVASTAFQNNPAIQPRAFAVMGCLAREEVDDDLLYQVLVALRNSVGRLGDDTNSDMLISIVTSLSKMMAKLPSASRYGLQLFWLAISLLRLVPPALFNCTAQFLEAVMTNISTVGDLRGDKMGSLLLQGRVQLEDAALSLDEAYGIHFTHENFHFAVCACLARGLADTTTKTNAMRVLSAFLDMAGNSTDEAGRPSDIISRSPYMALILARTVGSEELKDSLWLAGINPSVLGDVTNTRRYDDLSGMKDKDLLLNTAIELIDFQYLEDALQNRTLRWLTELASARPAVIMHLCGPIVPILDEVLLHCQNSATLESAQALLHALTSNPKFSSALESTAVLNEILEDMGFSGLWRSCSFNFSQDQDRKCFILTEKLIELIIV